MRDTFSPPFAFSASHFQFVKMSPAQLEDSYRLRFEVYCRQARLFPSEHYPEGLETDGYDQDAIHIGAYDCRGVLVGTLRLVRSPVFDLPMFRHCHSADIEFPVVSDPMAIAEVSRLSVAKTLARDSLASLGAGTDGTPEQRGRSPRALGSAVLAGLVRRACQEGRRVGIEQFIVAMEPALHRRLKRIDVHFDPAGAPFDYHGEVRPYVLSAAALEAGMMCRNLALKTDPARDAPPPPRSRWMQNYAYGMEWASA